LRYAAFGNVLGEFLSIGVVVFGLYGPKLSGLRRCRLRRRVTESILFGRFAPAGSGQTLARSAAKKATVEESLVLTASTLIRQKALRRSLGKCVK